jgi:hypothetical protein
MKTQSLCINHEARLSVIEQKHEELLFLIKSTFVLNLITLLIVFGNSPIFEFIKTVLILK